MCKIIVHCGYPKCGSSSLQGNLFERSEMVNDLSAKVQFPELATEFQLHEATRRFYIEIEKNGLRAFETVETLWKSHFIPNISQDLTNVISHESFTNMEFSVSNIIHRICSLHDDVEFMIVIRRQSDLLRSYYDMHPYLGNKWDERFAQFPEWLEFTLNGTVLSERLKYYSVIKSLLTVCDASKLHIFSFDELFVTYEGGARLANLLQLRDEEVLRALSAPALNDVSSHVPRKVFRKLLGPLHASWVLPSSVIELIARKTQSLFKAEKTIINKELEAEISGFYADENQALLHEFGIKI